MDQNQDKKDFLSQKKIIFPCNSDTRNYKWSHYVQETIFSRGHNFLTIVFREEKNLHTEK